MFISKLIARRQQQKWAEWLDENGKLISRAEKNATYSVEISKTPKADRLQRRRDRASTASELLPKNTLVSMVSTYDAFLGRLLKASLNAQPKVLNASEKQLTFAELADFDSIDAARSHIADAVIESTMRESHVRHFEWMEKAFSVKLRVGLECWPTFVELTQRRNLFVHCRGIASPQYIEVCKEHKAYDSRIKSGQALGATRDYVDEAYRCLYEIGVKLSQVLWRKLVPSQNGIADQALCDITYELLVHKRYKLVQRLLEFAVDVLHNISTDEFRRVFLVNLAQSYKFDGDERRCRERIESLDWSACGPKFKLCISVLLDRYDEAAGLMVSAHRSGELKVEDYYEWPLFRKFRASKQFLETLEEITDGAGSTTLQNRKLNQNSMSPAPVDAGVDDFGAGL